jgi:ribosomal RNA-processing protein 36
MFIFDTRIISVFHVPIALLQESFEMASSRSVQRNVRPQQPRGLRNELSDESVSDASDGGDQDISSLQSSSDDGSRGADSEADDVVDESPSEASETTSDGDGGPVGDQISNVSFGILKQAQVALSRKRKRGSDQTQDQDQKLEALRQRLRQIKESKPMLSSTNVDISRTSAKSLPRSRDAESNAQDVESDSDSAPSEEDDGFSRSRTSKHAPAAQSSKHQVSRRRTVIDVPQRRYRDPRFDAIQQQRSAHTGDSEKAYGFLREYQKAEIDELQAAAKKTRDSDDAERLRRTAGAMRNQIQAREAKERTQAVIRQHRREERLKVEQGKTPYYLKEKEIKERALVEKYKGLKSKERERLMERRQRKEGQKEKKRMPNVRRMVG